MADRPNADLDQVALQLLKDGRKIEAIRFIRVKTGIGLVEAKAYVEALERDGDPLAVPLPRAAQSGPQVTSGNTMVILLAAAVLAVLLWMLLNPA